MNRRAWFVPSLYAGAAIIAGLALPRLESRLLPELGAGMSVAAAIAIYASIASGTIALTGVVFSLVFIMVQFSATAYSPRLGLWVARNRLVAHAFGTFTATFLYAIAALAWVDRAGTATVPFVSALTVIALLLASVAMFVGLIERVAMLSVARMLAFSGDQGRRVINTIYPERYSPPGTGNALPIEARPSGQPTQMVVYHGRPAAVQRVDVLALMRLAQRTASVIEVAPSVGDTLIDSNVLLNVFGTVAPIDEHELRRAIVTGEERTFEQDPKYAIRILVDIAIRALSPAVNDPTTAVQALDQIGDLLLRLARRQLETGAYRDPGGTLRLLVAFPTWDDFLRLSFDEIQSYGAGSTQVARRLKALLADLIAAAPEERRPALKAREARLERAVARAFPDRDDQADASVEDRQGFGVPRRRPAA